MDRSRDVVSGPSGSPERGEDSEVRSDRIRGDIAETRAEMGETVRALRDRLKPRRIAREGGRRIDRSGRARGLMAVARAYPVAATVAGVTAGWMALRILRLLRR